MRSEVTGHQDSSHRDSAHNDGPHTDGRAEPRSVFVDASGRRSRTLRRFGWAVTIVCACYATTVAASLVGGSSGAPFLRIPGVSEGVAEAAEAQGDEAEAGQPSWEPTIPNGTLPADWGWVEGVVPPSATAEPAEPAGGGGASEKIEKAAVTDATDAVAPDRTPAGTDTAPTRPAPGETPPAGGSTGGGTTTPPAGPQQEEETETAPPAEEPEGNGNPIDGLLGGLLGLPPLLGG